MRTYKAHPLSLAFSVIVKAAVAVTIGIFVMIAGYVIIKRSTLFNGQLVQLDIYQ